MSFETPGRPSTPSLFADALSQMTVLFETEIRLVRTELSEKISLAIRTVVVIVAGGVLALLGLVLLLLGVIFGIAALGPPLWIVFLVAGAVIIAAGAIALVLAKSELSIENLMPAKSMDQLGKDATIVKEQVK